MDKPPAREYLILANIPILSSVQTPWKVYLVDNPGFDDAVSGITAVAEVAMKTASAYMYILDYNILQSQSDTEHFKLLYDKDPGMQNGICLCIWGNNDPLTYYVCVCTFATC